MPNMVEGTCRYLVCPVCNTNAPTFEFDDGHRYFLPHDFGSLMCDKEGSQVSDDNL